MFNKKRRYLKKKLLGVTMMIWDWEFKIYKSKELREEVRKEFDREREMADAYQKQIDNKDNKEETIKVFKEKLEATNKLLYGDQVTDAYGQRKNVGLEGQLKVSDIDIALLQEQMDGLIELKRMLPEYIKNNT